MAVKAKMRCTGRREWTNGGHAKTVEGVEVTLQPVYGDENDEANREWSKWTPSGELRLNITNPDAFRQFEIGKSYFVTLEPAGD